MHLSVSQRWILALGAPLHSINGMSHEWIGGRPITRDDDAKGSTGLAKWWGVTNRASLLRALEGLEANPTQLAWNLGRWIVVAGWGVREGFLKETEFWSRARPIAARVQQFYDSFADYGRDYARGRSESGFAKDSALDYHLEVLLHSSTSPWVRLPWSLDLEAPKHQVPELPFGSSEKSVKPSNAELIRTLVPRTKREWFAVNLTAMDAADQNDDWGILGEGPRWHSGAARLRSETCAPADAVKLYRDWFAVDSNSDLPQLRQFLGSLGEQGDVATVTQDLPTQRALTLLREQGEPKLSSARFAYRAAWTAYYAARAYRGGSLSQAEAWALLFEVARSVQPRFGSWNEFYDALDEGVFVASGWRASPRHSFDTLLSDPNSPLNESPWNTDLTVDEPLARVPRELALAHMSVHFDCPACSSPAWLPKPGREAQCEGCGWHGSISLETWRFLLWPELSTLRRYQEQQPRSRRTYNAELTFHQYTTLAKPTCGRGTALPPIELLLGLADPTGEVGYLWSCPCCGEQRHLWSQSTLLTAVDPQVLLWMQVNPPQPEAEATLATACIHCGVPLPVSAASRFPACPSCGVAQRLDDDLWHRLCPKPLGPALEAVMRRGPVRRWPTKPPYDLYADRGRAAMITNLVRLGNQSDCGFLTALPPNRALSPEQRAAASLGALSLEASGGDPERLAGFPRNATYQLPALKALEPLDLGSRDLVRGLLGQSLEDSPALALAVANRAEVLRHGYMLDWISDVELLEQLSGLLVIVRQHYSTWSAFAEAQISQTTEACQADLRAALLRLQRDAPSFEPKAVARGDLELISVEVVTRCPHCLTSVSIPSFPEVGDCPTCNKALCTGEPTLYRVLEPILFWARHLEPGLERETTDFRSWGQYHLRYRRSAPRCGTCREQLPQPTVIEAYQEGRSEFACPHCDARSKFSAVPQELECLDPAAAFVLLPAPRPASLPEVACTFCGGALNLTGRERVVRCTFCNTHCCLPDKAWKQLHPVAQRQALGFAVRGLTPRPHAFEGSASVHLLMDGNPVCTK